jgi:hypothetical protein
MATVRMIIILRSLQTKNCKLKERMIVDLVVMCDEKRIATVIEHRE